MGKADGIMVVWGSLLHQIGIRAQLALRMR